MKYVKTFESYSENERDVDVQIVDVHGDVKTETLSFSFNSIKDLNNSIDDYIKNELNIRRADVTIDDFSSILSTDEKSKLEDLGYDFDMFG